MAALGPATVRVATATRDDAAGAVPWWSFTKTALAIAALTLVRDRRLSLDGPMAGRRWTLRQLLQHRAGLTDYGDRADYRDAVARGDRAWPPAELLARTGLEPRTEPGSTWRYSNVGYLVLRQAIEAAAGCPLDALLLERVLRPVGLTQTRLVARAADLDARTTGLRPGYDPGWVYHGLLVGPLHEAARLLDGLLDGHLLPGDLLAAMRHPHPVGGPVPGRPWRAPAYGLGLMIDTGRAGSPTGHTGAGPDSVIAVYRRSGRGTVAAFAPGGEVGSVEARALAEDAGHGAPLLPSI